MNHPTTTVRFVSMRDGVDQSVDTYRSPITSAQKRSLVEMSECTPLSDNADRHDTTSHISGTHP
jgi:hypothetical protein